MLPSRVSSRFSLMVAGLAVVTVLAGCGRSAPVDALTDLDGDPEIAGVSVTSPDAVVATEPTTEGETVTSTTEAAAAAAQAEEVYVVKPGDTLSVIADSFGLPIQDLADRNSITNVNAISPGQELIIPARTVEVSVVEETTTTAQP